jgi:hypothetical protein
MSVNILKLAELLNVTTTLSGLRQRVLTRGELSSLASITTATGITIPASGFVCWEANLHHGFYCNYFSTNISNPYCGVSMSAQRQEGGDRYPLVPVSSGTTISCDFNNFLPDQSLFLCNIRSLIYNTTSSGVTISGAFLSTVDYPIEYSYNYFSIAASSYGNAQIDITNNSIQGTEKNIRVTPAYTNNFEVDRMFMLTTSGRDDTDKYHINRGYCLPEQIPWSSGFMTGGTTISGRYLTLSGTTTSGTWTSPVIYMSDPNYITMYVYSENTSDRAIVDKEWTTLNRMDTRGSNETPLPNFLIVSQTKQLNSLQGGPTSLPLPDKRPASITLTDTYDAMDPFWYQRLVKCDEFGFVGPVPFVYGVSQRIYMKGDGTVIAQNIPGYRDIGERDYFTGTPFKIFGDINDYWSAGLYIGLLGAEEGACDMDLGRGGRWNNMLYSSISPSSPTHSDWAEGRQTGSFGMPELPPFAFHFHNYSLGVCTEPITFDFIGSTTIHMDRHPNEWAVINAVMYPTIEGEDKYICIYLLNMRNFWVSEKLLLGIYGIGQAPCDEGYAVCRCNNIGNGEGGIWIHVGYADNILNKFTFDGEQLANYQLKRGYSFMRESGQGGLWMVRNDGVFYYEENVSNGTMDVVFVVEHDAFHYLYSGDVDAAGNLWVVDRDTSTIYRINLSTRSVDYENAIPYAVGIWPHPTDGSAFVYIGFDPSTFSTCIKRVWADDPYMYEELVTSVPSNPLSDLSGVQFLGKLSGSYVSPGVNDPTWGTDEAITLNWEGYTNGSFSLPDGNYKQFRLTLRKQSGSTVSPKITRIRIPEPLLLKNVPYGESSPVYINPHLRYDINTGHFTSELLTWWPHDTV